MPSCYIKEQHNNTVKGEVSHEVAGDNSVLDFWLSGYLS